MNNTILLIGPNFHDFNQHVKFAFETLGYSVIVQAYDTPVNPYSSLNKIRYKISHKKDDLKETCRQSFSIQIQEVFQKKSPQVVFILNGEMLTPEVIQFMGRTAKISLWLFDSITRLPHCWDILPKCNNVFCYEQDDIPFIRKRVSIEAKFLPQAVDPATYYTIQNTKKDFDIVFAADLWKSAKRKHLIQTVVHHFSNKKIRVWGIYKPWYKGFWESITRERRDIYTNCNASTAQLNLDYNRAKIVLNIHNEQQNNGANPKVYEISATGSYQICDANPYIEKLFPNGEIGLYHNEKELIEQINWALDPANEPEREARAKRAQEIVLSSHTFVDRIRQVME